jgi:type II secretory pathway predicted ATPase ExeA
VLDALLYAITEGQGIIKVSGEVGSGKTMLFNMLQNRLPENVESVYLANPSVGPDEVLHAIAFELQLGLDRHADRLEVMHALQDYLLARYAEDYRVVVFIEESQGMPIATLEEIRLLSNLETRNDKLLQIVLFGQPELDANLQRPEIRQLRDRITHSFKLQPLAPKEVHEYLMFRMRTAGYRGPEIFSPAVVKKIAKASSGLTRRINLIADKALLAAFSENTHTIQRRHIEAALRDSEFGRPEPWWNLGIPQRFSWAALTFAFSTIVAAVTYALTDGRSLAAPIAESSAADAQRPTYEAAAASREPDSRRSAESAKTQSDRQPARNTAGIPSSAVTAVVQPRAEVLRDEKWPSTDAAGNDVIASRMEATRKWLSAGDGSAWSIQLFVAEDERELRSHLKKLTKFIENNEVYLYRSVSHGRQFVSVLWGTFPDQSSAQRELRRLPASLRANKPYLRTVSGVRAEIEQARSWKPS